MKIGIILLLSILSLFGCATEPLSESQKSNIIETYINKEKLDNRISISAFNMDSWNVLSDQYLIIRTSPFRPYLIKLANKCHDLNFGPSLLVNTRTPNSLSEGFDSVYSPDNESFKCYISKIYPLDRQQHDQLKSALAGEQAPKEN